MVANRKDDGDNDDDDNYDKYEGDDDNDGDDDHDEYDHVDNHNIYFRIFITSQSTMIITILMILYSHFLYIIRI